MNSLWKALSIIGVATFLTALAFTPHFHWGYTLGGGIVIAIIAES